MANYLVRKFWYGILVLWGVITIIFMLFNLLPGDPARMMLGQRADETSIKIIRKDLGLHLPLHIQYALFINDILPVSVHNIENEEHYLYLDPSKYTSYLSLLTFSDKKIILKYPYLRRSYQTKRKVSDIISEALPLTAILAFASIGIAFIVGLALGIVSAINKDKCLDKITLFIATIGISLPSFVSAILIGWFFAFVLHDYTGLNMTGSLFTLDDYGEGYWFTPKNLILPALTLGIRPLSIITQLSRNSLLEVLNQDYIRTARAKGLSFFKTLYKHALQNALNPVVTAVSGWMASLMSGAVFVEMIFNWKGLGLVLIKSLDEYDLPVLMGCVLTFSIIFVFINLVVDVIYGILDPRITYS